MTEREVAFLVRILDLPERGAVLDVCCGAGRHLAGLSSLGYEVTGIERDPAVARLAREAAPAARVVEGDANRLSELVDGPFDAAICFWASFGYGTHAENAALLEAMGSVLGPSGRLVLDVYNRAFFEARAGVRAFERAGRAIEERTELRGDRLTTTLDYGAGVEDVFSWQVFTPDELVAVATAAGLSPVLVCAGFDEAIPAGEERARMQLVLRAERSQMRAR